MKELNRLDDDSWSSCDMPLLNVTIITKGTIIDQEGNFSIVQPFRDKPHYSNRYVLFNPNLDFANRYIGGGVMRRGMVQEEIMFMEMPELLATRVFWPVMKKNEAIVITGVKRYSESVGYAHKTEFVGKVKDTRLVDEHGRLGNHIMTFGVA
jgi:hypothetical protein